MMWSTIPCKPPTMFVSIVGHASFHTAALSGPSTSDRSKRRPEAVTDAVMEAATVAAFGAVPLVAGLVGGATGGGGASARSARGMSGGRIDIGAGDGWRSRDPE